MPEHSNGQTKAHAGTAFLPYALRTKTRAGSQRAVTQGAEIQELIFDSIRGIGECSGADETEAARARAQAIAASARAWTDIRRQIRVEQGKPGPGSLRPASKPAKRPKPRNLPPSWEPTEPAACGPAAPSSTPPVVVSDQPKATSEQAPK